MARNDRSRCAKYAVCMDKWRRLRVLGRGQQGGGKNLKTWKTENPAPQVFRISCLLHQLLRGQYGDPGEGARKPSELCLAPQFAPCAVDQIKLP